MTHVDERGFVRALYPGPKWHQRVDHMSDAQVHAIYMQKTDPDNKPKDPKDPKEEPF